ncbi:hypothetical protein CPB83DRAFT_908124 [Crepidotus variabilis]|uniref:F-box domain-containing protein n=1 Tax=Crepidotus variabilis TaxID=179855 RepID=A0A9P6EDH7_9AGAR|nr:hypothetical protein CPB83DRAFT_908124 [Crepidotus variabilis]
MSGARQTRRRAKFEEKWDLNLRNPGSQLPPEDLLLIFGFVRLGQEEDKQKLVELVNTQEYILSDSDDEFTENSSWVVVGQVCHRWREAALRSSELWSHIEFEDQKCRRAVEMLKRSKEVLLNIQLGLYFMDKRCKDKHTKMVVSRFALSQVQKIWPVAKNSLFGLETVTIPNSALFSKEMRCRTSKRSSLTTNYQELTAESLRILKLSYVALDLNAKFLRGLKTLQLYFCPILTPFLQLLDCLASMPSLKELDLQLFAFPLDRSELPLVKGHSLNSHPMELTHSTLFSSKSPLKTTALLLAVVKNPIDLDIRVLNMVKITQTTWKVSGILLQRISQNLAVHSECILLGCRAEF